MRKTQNPECNKGLSYLESPASGTRGTALSIIKLLIFSVAILSLLTCSKAGQEKDSQLVEPLNKDIYKITLSPSYVTKDSTITAKVKNVDPSDLSYQWIINDKEINGATEDTLKYPALRKHDSVQVRISIKGRGELLSEPLVVSNIVPQIQTANLIPSNPKKGDKLKVEVKTFDGDDDYVSLLYEWFINGVPSAETSDVIDIDGTLIKRGDKVSVKITPTDGEKEGQSITLYSIVANSPPRLLPSKGASLDGRVYTSKVIAEDPDGDPLTYTLQRGPEGMTIDSESGVITWEVAPRDEGEHDVIVSINDGHGGEIVVPFITTISFTQPR